MTVTPVAMAATMKPQSLPGEKMAYTITPITPKKPAPKAKISTNLVSGLGTVL